MNNLKKTILTLIITFALSNNCNAQSFGVPDTLAYLKTIVANKASYIGKPFSVLKDSLKLEIKYFSPMASIPHYKFKETHALFAFYFPLIAEEMYLTYPCIRVFWLPYLNASQSDVIWRANNGGRWNLNAYNFYNSAVIHNIDILE